MCGAEVHPTIQHVLGECSATTTVCNAHNVPSLPEFCRWWVLNRTAVELSNFASDLFAILDSKGSRKRSREHAPIVL